MIQPKSKLWETIVLSLLLGLLVVWTVFPFCWAILTSLKTGTELFKPDLFPKTVHWSNYRSIFIEQPFGKNLLNSVIIAVSTVLISVGLALFAAYSFSRQRFRGRKLLILSFLFVAMFPQIAVLSGLYELVRALGLYNKIPGLVLVYMIITLPFCVWTLFTFMKDVPKGIEESALLDGAGPVTLILRIFLPLMAPSLVTTGLLSFILVWNEFLFALTFGLTDRAKTVPVAIAMMSGSSQYEIPWGMITAASVTVTLPIMLIVIVFQKRIVEGLTAGAVKG